MNSNTPFPYYPFASFNPLCMPPTLMFPGFSFPLMEMDYMRSSMIDTKPKKEKEQEKMVKKDQGKKKLLPQSTLEKELAEEEISVYTPYSNSKSNRSQTKAPKQPSKEQLSNETATSICNNRNMNSNLLRVFFRRLEIRLKNQQTIIGRIIEKYSMKISVEDFIDWYSRNKINHRNYIRITTVQKLFASQIFNEEQTKIMRILLQHFVKNEATLCYLTSKKVGKEEAGNNFLAFRTIVTNLID